MVYSYVFYRWAAKSYNRERFHILEFSGTFINIKYKSTWNLHLLYTVYEYIIVYEYILSYHPIWYIHTYIYIYIYIMYIYNVYIYIMYIYICIYIYIYIYMNELCVFCLLEHCDNSHKRWSHWFHIHIIIFSSWFY